MPSAHYVAADYANDDYVLVLQDLGHLRVGDQSAGVTAADAAAVMRTVAGMHAHFGKQPNSIRLIGCRWQTQTE